MSRFPMSSTLILVAGAAFTAYAQQPAPPDDAKVSGYSGNSSLPTDPPKVIWKFESETKTGIDGQKYMTGLTDAVVDGEVVYFAETGEPGRVFALNAVDGSKVWQHDHASSRINAEPSIDQDQVYFGSRTGVTALRRDHGTEVWNHAIEHGAGEGPPLPVGDRLYISGYDGNAYCLDRVDGRVVWQHNFTEDAPPDPPGFESKRARFQEIAARPRGAACDGKLFIQSVFDQSRLVALDCATGQRQWSFQAAGWIGPAPTIVNDRVYVVSQDKHLYCLERDTGHLVWKFEARTWLASRVAVHNGKVFLPVHLGWLHQLDAQSGALIETFIPPQESDRKGMVYSFPIITDRCAYFAVGEGQLYAVDIETSRLLWKLRPSEHSELFTDPATDGHRIFVTSRQDNNKAGECAVIAIGN